MTRDPRNLFSPEYHEAVDGKRRWLLMRSGVRRSRVPWGSPLAPARKVCYLHREIVYLDRRSVAEGRGQAWLPLNWLSAAIVRRCLSPWSPKPLGLVLEELFGADRMTIVRRGPMRRRFTEIPYWPSRFEVVSYQRVHIQKSTRRIIAFSEEDFVLKRRALEAAAEC